MRRAAAAFALLLGATTSVHAETPTTTPLAVNVIGPLRLFDRADVIGASVNLIGGRADRVRGVNIGGIYNRVDRGVIGIQAAGVFNMAGKKSTAIQVAFGANGAEGGNVIQLAGVMNYAGKGTSGLQFAFLGNGAETPSKLIQVGGVLNMADKGGSGIQVALGINNGVRQYSGLQIALMNLNGSTIPVATGRTICSGGRCGQEYVSTHYPSSRSTGVMIGGVWNMSKHHTGLQVAGLINASSNLSGMQVAPLMNMARDVRGVQIGAVNVARKLKGLQIGLVNIAYKNSLPVMLGLNAGF